jgi:putative ABC transport system permease protein
LGLENVHFVMKTWIELDYGGLLWSLGLVLLAIALSFWQKLKLEQSIILACSRAFLQLLILGTVLALGLQGFPFCLFVILLFLTLSTFFTTRRISEDLPALFWPIWFTLLLSTVLVVSLAILLIIRPSSNLLTQYLLVLTLVTIASSSQASIVAGARLVNYLNNNRLEIETRLCLGACYREAISIYRLEAIKSAMSLNQIMWLGLVSLPTLMAGQIISGVDPLNAASYQLLLTFMLILANLVTLLLVTEAITQSYFNSSDQLIL